MGSYHNLWLTNPLRLKDLTIVDTGCKPALGSVMGKRNLLQILFQFPEEFAWSPLRSSNGFNK